MSTAADNARDGADDRAVERRLRQALAVWVVGLLVYLLAVFHRSSLAVAGLAAAERFDIGASQLATFTMLQLLVYAAMQIPVGLLVDRFGPRAVLLVGAVTLTLRAGRASRSRTATRWALLARVFVGMGDAMTFICVLRLVNTWFAPRRIPIITQLTGVIGQSGAILAAIPMTWALCAPRLDHAPTCSRLRSGIVLGIALLLVVHDAPGQPVTCAVRRCRSAAIRASLAASWEHPGTRLGFWMHFSTQFSATTLGLLWGYPFFVHGEGRSERDRRPAAHADGGGGDERRSGARLADHRAAVAPLDAGARDRARDRGCLDRRAGLAGRRAAVAARGAGRGRGGRRSGLDDRVRPRAHVQPGPTGWPAPPGSSTRAASTPACCW